jgi:hypothetical protein
MVKNFYFSMLSRSGLGPTQPPIHCGTVGSIPGLKRPGRRADPSFTISTEVKKAWIYTSTPPYVFMVWPLISQAQIQIYLLPIQSKLKLEVIHYLAGVTVPRDKDKGSCSMSAILVASLTNKQADKRIIELSKTFY